MVLQDFQKFPEISGKYIFGAKKEQKVGKKKKKERKNGAGALYLLREKREKRGRERERRGGGGGEHFVHSSFRTLGGQPCFKSIS